MARFVFFFKAWGRLLLLEVFGDLAGRRTKESQALVGSFFRNLWNFLGGWSKGGRVPKAFSGTRKGLSTTHHPITDSTYPPLRDSIRVGTLVGR